MDKPFAFVVVLFLSIFSVAEVDGQWRQLNIGSPGRVNTVSVFGQNIFAGTDAGIYRSTDDGLTWKIVNNRFALRFISEGNYIFAGTSNGVFLSSDNGSTWSSSGSIGWVDAFAMKGSDIYAGTQGGGVYRSTDNGAYWIAVNAGLGPYQNMVNALAVNGNELLAGTAAGLCVSTDDGNNWSTLYSQQYINCITPDGSTIFVGTPGGMLKSTDGGTSWYRDNAGFPSGSSGFLPSILCVTATDSEVFTGTTASVYRSTDDGESWSQDNDGLPVYPQQVFSVAINGSHFFASTFDGVFLSTDNGEAWTQSSDGIIASSFSQVAGTGAFVCGAAGRSLFVSYNYGRTWQVLPDTFPSSYLQSLTMIGVRLYAVTNGGIYLSPDSGRSWIDVSGGLMDTTYPTHLVQVGSNLIASTQGNAIYLSTDNGATWRKTGGNFPLVTFSLNLVGTNVYAGFYEAGLYVSTDDGESWSEVNDTLYGIASVVSIGSTLIAARPPWAGPVLDHSYHYLGGVFRSDDNGESWTQLTSGLPFDPQVTPLVVHGSDVYLGIDGYGVFFSDDEGDQWKNVGGGLPDLPLNWIFVNDSSAFVGFDGGGVWVRPLSEITAVSGPLPPEIPTTFVLSQNYPNPFNPSTTIQFNVPISGLVSLKVYDMLGRVVKTLVDSRESAGGHAVTFDASGLQSGVYFYRLQAGSYTGTKKCLLLK